MQLYFIKATFELPAAQFQSCKEGLMEDVDPDLGKMLAGCAKLQKYSRQDENVKWKNKLQLLLTDSPAGEDAGKQEVTTK